MEMKKEIETAENHSSSDDTCVVSELIEPETPSTDECFIVLPKTYQELENVEELLKTNGKSIKHLRIHDYRHRIVDNQAIHRLMKLIKDYCSMEQITELELHGIVQLESVFHLPKVFPRLEKLKMDSCNIRMFFFPGMLIKMIMYDNLKELDINNAIVDETKHEEKSTMKTVFEEHLMMENNLEKLSICNSNLFDSTIFNNIPKNLKSLQFMNNNEIEDLEQFHNNLNNLTSAIDLKELKLNCRSTSIADYLAKLAEANIKLETLQLTNVMIDDSMVEQLIQMTTLRELKLFNIQFDEDATNEKECLSQLPTHLLQLMLHLSTHNIDLNDKIETWKKTDNKSILWFEFDKLLDGAKVTTQIKICPR